MARAKRVLSLHSPLAAEGARPALGPLPAVRDLTPEQSLAGPPQPQGSDTVSRGSLGGLSPTQRAAVAHLPLA